MTDVLVVLCSVPCKKEARQIGTLLVEGKYAACVSIIPAVESIYSWEGEVQHDDELLLVIKTSREVFPRMSEHLKAIHSYDEPEIIALPVEQGAAGYVKWLKSYLS